MFDLCELSNVPLPGALRRRQEPSSAILFHAPIRVFVCDCWCGSGRNHRCAMSRRSLIMSHRRRHCGRGLWSRRRRSAHSGPP
jgi:hypothetical protein